jgi:hypothetical protein
MFCAMILGAADTKAIIGTTLEIPGKVRKNANFKF